MANRRIRSLSELPTEIAPPRDLWPAIEAAIAPTAAESDARDDARGQGAGGARRRFAPQYLALAASVVALAVGVWIGRSTLPVGTGAPATQTASTAGQPAAIPAAFVNDPAYRRERAQLVSSLESRLKALPPETQAKVAASLKTIRSSMQDLEAALGRDPSNALLQELLVNTYQEEMRVLTTVNEAGAARQEI